MAFADMVDIETINDILGITDGKYDEIMDAALPFILFKVKSNTGIDYDSLNEEEQIFMLGVIAVAIGCHIMKTDPAFGLKYQNWSVGKAKKSFFRRYASDFENWCDLYEDLMTDVYDFLGTATISGQRPGVLDDYTLT